MSDYRNYGGDPNDPLHRNFGYEPTARGGAWGWIIGAAFLVVVLVLAFGMSHEPKRVASNNVTPPSATYPATPSFAPNRP